MWTSVNKQKNDDVCQKKRDLGISLEQTGAELPCPSHTHLYTLRLLVTWIPPVFCVVVVSL